MWNPSPICVHGKDMVGGRNGGREGRNEDGGGLFSTFAIIALAFPPCFVFVARNNWRGNANIVDDEVFGSVDHPWGSGGGEGGR